MDLKNKAKLRTWVEISKKSLLHNFNTFKKLAGEKVGIMSVVKANAYGHGINEVASLLEEAGSDWFAVDNLDEALTIRLTKVKKPILILGYIPITRVKEAIENDISFVLYREDFLSKIALFELGKKAKVHLKIETGLNRQGLSPNEAVKFAMKILQGRKVELEGISTHFANIEDTRDPAFAMEQLSHFKTVLKKLNAKKIKVSVIHCAASAASLLYKETHFNMLRLGISMYGLWPSKEIRNMLSLKKGKSSIDLKPVLEWKSKLAQVKTLKAGESVGYGRTWFAPRRTKIAIIPVGYYDGYDRDLSNNSRVLIRGNSAPVVGRVAMNMITVDVTDINKVSEDDEVVLIGKSNKERITADELATVLGTINYEVVSRINPYLPRIIV